MTWWFRIRNLSQDADKSITEKSHVIYVHGVYRHACPNCGGSISDRRLLYKAPCENCIPEDRLEKLAQSNINGLPRFHRLKIIVDSLVNRGKLGELVKEEEELQEIERFFAKATKGFTMWSAQRTWARRIIRRESFSIIAPTGTGKTVFSIIMALYKATRDKNNGKIYIVFPTTPLLIQAWRKLLLFSENLGLNICSMDNWNESCLRVVCIHGKLRSIEKQFYMEKIKEKDFDILLSTSAFLHKYGDVLPKGVYELIVMDDVDAVLRSGRAVRRLLKIIGVDEDTIEKGLELIRARARIVSARDTEIEELRRKIDALEREIEAAKKRAKNTILVVNSATGRPRGIYPKLFRIFLDFEAGAKPEAIRNIVDTYLIPPPDKLDEAVIEIVEKLRDGVLVFVPVDRGVEYAEYLANKIRERGIPAEAFHSKKQVELIDKFSRGEIDVLVGVATYYGVIVRGIDLPERVKYVVFAGIPRHRFSSAMENISPTDILRMLTVIREVVDEKNKEELDLLIGRLSRKLRTLTQGALIALRDRFLEYLQKREVVEETPLMRDLLRAYDIIREQLSKPDALSKLSRLGDIGIQRENGVLYILIPDVATYIQASGRCSRLYPGGITKGLSVIVVDDQRLLNGLVKRLRWIFEGFNIKELSGINLDELIKEIGREREKVRKILSGEITPDQQLELVKTALLIVESPNKARTIANFFGKPSLRIMNEGLRVYEVSLGNYLINIVATGGHVYDLVVDDEPVESSGKDKLYGVIVEKIGNKRFYIPIYTDIKKCDQGHQFTDESERCPKCGLSIGIENRKLSIINALRKVASEVDIVLVGTDPDSEGEKIAWDIRVLLEPYVDNIKRIEFHEVTRRAIINALSNPRDFNDRLVEAQIVRRIEDRWLGFSLSKVLQRYAWPIYCIEYLFGKNKIDGNSNSFDVCCKPNRNLSAGRVQTPVLGFIISEYYKTRDPKYSKYLVEIALEREIKISIVLSYEEAERVLIKDSKGRFAKEGTVELRIIDEKIEEINPPPPFTTDTLLEEASIQLGFSTTRTMELAQDLFEMGFITYHRTDSTRVSDAGIEIARQYLEGRYGTERYKEVFKPRVWGVGGAHEAIRPTRPIDADHLAELVKEGAIVVVGKITRDHFRLYDLIFKRFIASQMKPAVIVKQRVEIKFTGGENVLSGEGNNVQRDLIVEIRDRGYLDIYENIRVEIPRLGGVGSSISGYITDIKQLKYPLPRFHDAVRWMKENGIGRPSTYAKIIQTIIDRGYVKLSKKQKAIIALRRGEYFYKYLVENFGNIVDVETTRMLEKIMDNVENGNIDYQLVLDNLYDDVVEKILSRESNLLENLKRQLEEIAKNRNRGYIPPDRIKQCIDGLSI